MNRTLIDRVRCMLIDSKLPKGFWAEALMTAAKIVNSVPCKGTGNVSPEEVYTGKQPDFSIFRVFGCKAFAHIPDAKRKKLDNKAVECIHIGYADDSKAYKLFNTESKTVVISRDVTFIENEVNGINNNNTNDFVITQGADENYMNDLEAREANTSSSTCASSITHNEQEPSCSSTATVIECIELFDTASEDSQSSNAEYSCKGDNAESLETANNDDITWRPDDSVSDISTVEDREPSRRLADKPKPNYACVITTSADPITIKEAMTCGASEQWKCAMQEEMNSLIKNGTWTLEELPKNKKPIMCKWVFKTKQNGESIRYKARLVAKGFSQVAGVDYDETFSPVVRHTSIRFLLAIAVKYNLKVSQMDVVTAFLHSDLDTEIYMH